MFRRLLTSLMMAGFLSGAAAGVVSAQSANVQAALVEANKVLQKGGYVKAIEIIDTALRSGKVPSELAAKALLMRAEANEKLGRSAFALADYNSALWMQGLSAADRKRAEEGQGRVTKGLGVADSGGSPAPAPPVAASAAPAQPQQQQRQAAEAQRARAGGNQGGGGFFSNLFGSSNSSPAEPPRAQTRASAINAQPDAAPEPLDVPNTAAEATRPADLPTTSAAVAEPGAAPEPQIIPPKRTAGAAASPAKPPEVVSALAATTSAAAAAAAPAKPPETGNFAIQLAALTEEDKAIAEADRLAKKFTSDLGGRTPSLMIVPTSDGGTLYKVVAAPFETRGEGLATCELLKTRGVSCMVITKK